MRIPRRISADGLAAMLLVAAAVGLLATPYDGGACRNVAAAYALPAASLTPAATPGEPTALGDARAAVSAAQAHVDALSNTQADVDRAQQAAQQARDAADKAASDQFSNTSSSDADMAASQAQDDLDLAQSQVTDDQDMLTSWQQDAADSPGDSFYAQQIQQAQATLDADKAKLATAQEALQTAQNKQSASAAAATAAQQNADKLSAAADAAQKAADDAASTLAAQQSTAQENLNSAQSDEAQQEADYRTTVNDWSHSRRLESDHVTALNNVRSSCRTDGSRRATVAGIDLLLLAAIAAVQLAPQLRGLGRRAKAVPQRLRWRRR